MTGRNDATAGGELIAVSIDQQKFAIDIMSVREIRCWTPPTTLPHTPNFVRGVINLRGFVLPIIDLASRFGFPPTEPSAQHVIIVTQIGNRTVGLLVDAVSDILTVTDDLVQPTPDIVSDMVETFVRGVFLVDGRMISLVALDDIVPSSERDAA